VLSDKNLNIVSWLLMAGLLAWFAYFKGWIFADFTNISPQDAHKWLSSPNKIVLIDVRSKKEFERDHIAGARHIPMSLIETESIRDGEILVYSERGERSVKASRILSRRGYQSVSNLEGGVVFWIRAGYKVTND